MPLRPLISLPVLALAAGFAGCESQATNEVSRAAPVYQGIDTRLMDSDLVNIHVAMSGADSAEDVDQYAECAAAQYTLIRGYGFARHVRTKVVEEGGIWRGDAVYTISPALPRGLKTIDAEVVAAHCAENGIPMV
ncbi:hypothetical protein [Roseovarius aestuarii]|uniref:Lipoprotein n=1 Tax=Roseovarius aestuarii TaxID=475083 RepID=A0A1X7BMM5_9RHOB|nr:hypothetical protein [Roseovarius aestuarii]SMC10888.1 hypothetical protein ROA7745_00696 [Roseovarius aestuarii]